MADPHLLEDQATLYVLGALGPVERHQFEAGLAISPDLRELVRDLEAGTVALTLALPPCEPPPHLWRGIDEIVSQETTKAPALSSWRAWMRSGWATAACLLGWLIYACWVNLSEPAVTPPPTVSAHTSGVEQTPSTPTRSELGHASSPSPARTLTPAESPAPQPTEIAGLRGQIADLQGQVGQLSQVITQQQAVLSQSGRLRFFHLVPQDSRGRPAGLGPPSAALQRALLLALARELGWVRVPLPDAQYEPEEADLDSMLVDFVDLKSPANPPLNGAEETGTSNPPSSENFSAQIDPSAQAGGDSAPATDPAPPGMPGNGIPALVFEDTFIVVVDSSMISSGDSFTVSAGTEPVAVLTMGTNPVVVVGQFSPTGAGGQPNFTIHSGGISFGVTEVAAPPLPAPAIP